MVNDQDNALKFYTDILGFIKKQDIPMGKHRWLTVASAEEPDGVQILLEPMEFEPSKTYQKALFDAGIPINAFTVADIDAEYERLNKAGVTFGMKPTLMGNVKVARLEDTCGNHIQLIQMV